MLVHLFVDEMSIVALPRAKRITNNGGGQAQDSTAACTLDDSSSKDGVDVLSNRANERADEEDEDGSEKGRFPAEDVAKRAPRGSRS